jgi:hypothetical protein
MGVQARPAFGRRVYEEERDVRVAVQVPLEPVRGLAVRELVLLDDAGSGTGLRLPS